MNGTRINIGVIGVGGGGCNAVNKMIKERRDHSNPESIEKSVFNDVKLIVANTDSMDLQNSSADEKIQLGANLTSGWGAGADPEKGRDSAEESKVDIASAVENFDMIFITAGMGGGTGTGASPVVASVASEAGILTVGVVTMPFKFEGSRKMRIADEYLEKLEKEVDALVVIPNEKLVDIAEPTDDARKMFEKPNEVLIDAVENIAGLICDDSFINVDFADVNAIMRKMGKAMIGIGSASGENAAINAVKEALNNPLLSDISIKGSTRMLLHFGGMNINLKELTDAAEFVNKQTNDDANFIWGASVNENSDKCRAIIVAEASGEKSDFEDNKNSYSKGQQKLFDMNSNSSDENKVSVGSKSKIETIIENELNDDNGDDGPDIEILSPAAEKREENGDNVVHIKQEHMSKTDDDEINYEVSESDVKIPAYLRKGTNFSSSARSSEHERVSKNKSRSEHDKKYGNDPSY